MEPSKSQLPIKHLACNFAVRFAASELSFNDLTHRSYGAGEVAPRWSRPPTKDRCREGGAEEGSTGDADSPEGEDGSPPSQASPWSWSSTWVEGEGGMDGKTDEPIAQLATRISKELHRRLKLHCVTHDTSVMEFVTAAIEEKLGWKPRPKKGTA